MKQMTDTGLSLGKWLGGAAAGALIMYMLDPDRGRARRTMTTERIREAGHAAGERMREAGHATGERIGSVWHDLGSRIGGSRLFGKPDGHAEAVGESVSQMGREAREAASETLHRAEHLASDMRGADWAPAMRNSAMVGGGMLGLYGLMQRSPLGVALGLAGLALLARGAANKPLSQMMLHGPGLARTIDLEKSIHIDAAPEEVYDLWANFENFPRFMSHVVDVRDLGRRRSHWVVKGPVGSEYEFDSVLTEQQRPRRLSWRTEPGSEIQNMGSVEFRPHRGGTMVTVRMSYIPPAGVIGHGLASLLGADPKREMDDDLARMKALIERGALPAELAHKGRATSRFLH